MILHLSGSCSGDHCNYVVRPPLVFSTIILDYSITKASFSFFILPKFSPTGCSTKQYRSWLHFLKQCVTRIITTSALRCASVRGTIWLGFIMWSKDRKYIVTHFSTLKHISVQKCSAHSDTADNYQLTLNLHVSQQFIIIMTMKKVYKLSTMRCNG